MLKPILLAGAALIATPALAQTAPATPPAPETTPPATTTPETTTPPAPGTPQPTPPAVPVDPAAPPAPATAEAAPPAPAAPVTAAPAPGAEIADVVSKEFPAYDKNKDGKLSKAEFGAWMFALRKANDPALKDDAANKAYVTGAFTTADTDKSKSISKDELTNFLVQGTSKAS